MLGGLPLNHQHKPPTNDWLKSHIMKEYIEHYVGDKAIYGSTSIDHFSSQILLLYSRSKAC